jgi:hypothetical protein
MEIIDDLLSLFGMDPLRDIEKASSTQMIIEMWTPREPGSERNQSNQRNQRGGY